MKFPQLSKAPAGTSFNPSIEDFSVSGCLLFKFLSTFHNFRYQHCDGRHTNLGRVNYDYPAECSGVIGNPLVIVEGMVYTKSLDVLARFPSSRTGRSQSRSIPS